ncbi:MAG TPA: DUF2508 family protein [Syntrophomonadaceae bacterium]|nr:DUF2508 family protein [Syntrophomonadaceae bacterium]
MCRWRTCQTLMQRWLLLDDSETQYGGYSFKQMADDAVTELKQAHDLLNQVTDPDMIDYAVYSLKAAEKRYDFVIKNLKKQEKAYYL